METYMVVMRNVFSAHMKIHKKYDLKGSTIDREVNSSVNLFLFCPILQYCVSVSGWIRSASYNIYVYIYII